MTTTAVYTAQDALLDLIRGLDSIGGWKVDLGFPAAANVQTKHIWLAGDIRDHDQVFAISSLQAKDETFLLRVHVVNTSRDNTYRVPRDKVRIITDELEQAINADWTLGGAVMLAEVRNIEWDEAIPEQSTRQVMATVTVACRTWLEN